MSHPETAGVGWNLSSLVYDTGGAGIAVAMFERHDGAEQALGFRWVYDGSVEMVAGREWRSPYFGKSSEWVLLPNDFAVAVARTLIEKKAAGLEVDAKGFAKMIEMLTRNEDILPVIVY